ncbi:MAG: diaminopimelate epimerase [Bacteroidales bacterium]|jgi:diaminopimelate epimerase|nr:diaminopimelate epimerase [Bacteroidales bacterium]
MNKEITFSKYEGNGNDFILIDNRCKDISLTEKDIQFLCDRHFGVGSDGLIILNKSLSSDFEMLFFNSDATKDMMCGNGGRCLVAFARDLGIIDNETEFIAADGKHKATIKSIPNSNNYIVKLSLKDVKTIKEFDEGLFIDIGTPHLVCFLDDIDSVDVETIGRKLRYNEKFNSSLGTNVNFVQVKPNGQLYIRTYERGVEKETLSCGTGVTASAIAYSEKYNLETNEVFLHSKGGDFKVYFNKTLYNYQNIFLEGKASKVFSGVIIL